MPLRPSILKNSASLLGSTKVSKILSEEDSLVIEDSSGRLKINSAKSAINISHFISGIVVAFKGSLDEKGLFCVNDYLFYQPEYSIQEAIKAKITQTSSSNLPQMLLNAKKGNEMIVFVSGLSFGSNNNNLNGQMKLSRNMLLNFIKGRLSSSDDLVQLSSKIAKVVLVGNSIASPDDIDDVERGSFRKKDTNQRVCNQLALNYDLFDEFINELANYLPIDVMPGQNDIVSSYFPSMAMSPIMFIESKPALNKTLHLATNPYYFNFKDLSYLGTSGENIQTIFHISSFNDGLEVMKKTLEWGNISPSSPDIQRSYSFDSIDPLVIKQMPNVYFCGNQSRYGTELYQYKGEPIRLISIPEFTQTLSIVLLDSITLDTCELKFQYN